MHSTLKIALAIAGLITLYVLWCLAYPYAVCSRCDGGKNRLGRTFNYCASCEGSNKKIRTGRYLLRLFGVPLPK